MTYFPLNPHDKKKKKNMLIVFQTSLVLMTRNRNHLPIELEGLAVLRMSWTVYFLLKFLYSGQLDFHHTYCKPKKNISKCFNMLYCV